MGWIQSELGKWTKSVSRITLPIALRIWKRRLAKEEETLGILGWQQVEWPDSDQPIIDQIYAVENRQVELMHRTSELAQRSDESQRKLEELQKKRELNSTELAAKRLPLAEVHEAALKPLRTLDEKAAVFTRSLAEIEAVLAKEDDVELWREKGEMVLKLGQFRQNREPLLASEREKAKSLQDHDHHTEEVLERLQIQEDEINEWLREAEHDKAVLERQSLALEKEKVGPYRAMGHKLAEAKIAPRNQPEALQRVLEARRHVERLEREIAEGKVDTTTDPTLPTEDV